MIRSWAQSQGTASQVGLGFAIAFTLIASTTASAKTRTVVVTPNQSNKFRCQVSPEKLPMTLEDGMLVLKVGVLGAKGPFYWRVPFREYSNGENKVSLAQAGEASLRQDGMFTIAVDTTQLVTENEERKIRLQLIAKNGAEAHCVTHIAAIEKAVQLDTSSLKAKPASLE